MRRILKKPSPELIAFIKSEKEQQVEPVYEGGLDSKEEYKSHFLKIRKQLVEEQGYICCYCQQRIDIQEGQIPLMKLEHFKPKGQSRYLELSLDYKNFLAACLGNTADETHCDSRKKGKELEEIPNPTTKEFDSFKIRYIAYKIARNPQSYKDTDRLVEVVPLWDIQIKQAKKNDVQEARRLQNHDPLTGKAEGCLNLNHQTLKSKRFNMWKSISKRFYKEVGDNWHTEKGKVFALELIETLGKPQPDGKLDEFCQVMIDLLKKEFKLF